MDEDTIAKTEFIEPILNFLNNFGEKNIHIMEQWNVVSCHMEMIPAKNMQE